MPLTLSFSAQMVPAPMKPIPATIPAAILAGSTAKLTETTVKRQAPSETSMCVRSPAGLAVSSLSMPTRAPNATANSKLTNVSRVNTVCIAGNYSSAAIKTHSPTQQNRKRFTYAPPFTSTMPHDSPKHLGLNRQHPNGADKPPKHEPQPHAIREAGETQHRRLRQRPHSQIHDRTSRKVRTTHQRQDCHRADQRQHRHRLSHSLPRKRLQPLSGYARKHDHGAQANPQRHRRQNHPQRSRQRHGRRRGFGAQNSQPKPRQILHAQPICESGERARALRDHGGRNPARHQRKRNTLRGWHRHHGHPHGRLQTPQRTQPKNPSNSRGT